MDQDFENEQERLVPEGQGFRVDLEGYEGPIDALLQLARDQKVDLKNISILQLADQYLEFVREARRLRLELAADYLVMAAWLAYLKSRLLLPDSNGEEEPSGAEMAAALKFQLQRLQAMQEAGDQLRSLPQMGQDFFRRGEPQKLEVEETVTYEATLYDLLKAYSRNKTRAQAVSRLRVVPLDLYSVDDVLQRIERLIGVSTDWQTLSRFLPSDLMDNLTWRSAVAATFAASLEMAKQGKLKLRQDGVFGPIYLRKPETETVTKQ